MSTDEKDDVPAPELPVFRGEDVPVYDLGGLEEVHDAPDAAQDADSGEAPPTPTDPDPEVDEGVAVHNLDSDDEEILVHDLDSGDEEEVVVYDLDSDDDDEVVVYDVGADEDDEIVVHDLDSEGEDELVAQVLDSVQDDEPAQGGSRAGGSLAPIPDGRPHDGSPVHDLGTDDEDVPVHDLGTPEDETPVYDLSTSQDREAVLAEALAHAATQEAQYKQPIAEVQRTGRWKTPLAMVVFALSAYLLVFPPPWVTGSDFPVASDSQLEHGIRAALFLQAQQVEAFRVRHGRLPASLEEVERALPGIQFIRSNNRVFQLVAPGVTGPNIIYDSARPNEEFQAAAAGWGVNQP